MELLQTKKKQMKKKERRKRGEVNVDVQHEKDVLTVRNQWVKTSFWWKKWVTAAIIVR